MKFLFTLLGFFLFAVKIEAATITISEKPTSTSFQFSDELVFKIILDINASNETKYYLRGVFSKEGETKYCGYTWNGSSWFRGPYTTNDGWKQFLPISITDNKWEGEVKAKVDTEDSDCADSGNYSFKIQRFTESGSGNFDDQESPAFSFTMPTPTPTPTSTPTPTKVPTSTPKPTKSESISVVKSEPTSFIDQESEEFMIDPTKPKQSLIIEGESEVLAANDTAKDEVVNNTSSPNNGKSVFKFMILTGTALFMLPCGILLYRKYKKEKEFDL